MLVQILRVNGGAMLFSPEAEYIEVRVSIRTNPGENRI
jgi:hypothetical protein